MIFGFESTDAYALPESGVQMKEDSQFLSEFLSRGKNPNSNRLKAKRNTELK